MENAVLTIKSYIQTLNIYLDDTSITYKTFCSHLPPNLDYIIYGVEIPLYYCNYNPTYINTCKTCNIESDYLILTFKFSKFAITTHSSNLNQIKEHLKPSFESPISTSTIIVSSLCFRTLRE